MNKQLLYLWVSIFSGMLTRQMSTNAYPFWRKWGFLKLKEGKQMLTLLVSKCLFAYRVSKHGGIYNIPMLTQVLTLGINNRGL